MKQWCVCKSIYMKYRITLSHRIKEVIELKYTRVDGKIAIF